MKVLKNNYFSIAALCILTIGVVGNMTSRASNLNPSDPPGVTMKTLDEIYDAVVAGSNPFSQREGFMERITAPLGFSDLIVVPAGKRFVLRKVNLDDSGECFLRRC